MFFSLFFFNHFSVVLETHGVATKGSFLLFQWTLPAFVVCPGQASFSVAGGVVQLGRELLRARGDRGPGAEASGSIRGGSGIRGFGGVVVPRLRHPGAFLLGALWDEPLIGLIEETPILASCVLIVGVCFVHVQLVHNEQASANGSGAKLLESAIGSFSRLHRVMAASGCPPPRCCQQTPRTTPGSLGSTFARGARKGMARLVSC